MPHLCKENISQQSDVSRHHLICAFTPNVTFHLHFTDAVRRMTKCRSRTCTLLVFAAFGLFLNARLSFFLMRRSHLCGGIRHVAGAARACLPVGRDALPRSGGCFSRFTDALPAVASLDV